MTSTCRLYSPCIYFFGETGIAVTGQAFLISWRLSFTHILSVHGPSPAAASLAHPQTPDIKTTVIRTYRFIDSLPFPVRIL
jgi:hypothetical protein